MTHLNFLESMSSIALGYHHFDFRLVLTIVMSIYESHDLYQYIYLAKSKSETTFDHVYLSHCIFIYDLKFFFLFGSINYDCQLLLFSNSYVYGLKPN